MERLTLLDELATLQVQHKQQNQLAAKIDQSISLKEEALEIDKSVLEMVTPSAAAASPDGFTSPSYSRAGESPVTPWSSRAQEH
jgi:hypothetical protein